MYRAGTTFDSSELQTGREHYDACVDIIVDVLNSCRALPGRKWVRRDIVRAHRLGGKRDNTGKPRPMIAQFAYWGDKMEVLTKERDRLFDMGISVANDLTDNQRETRCIRWTKQQNLLLVAKLSKWIPP